MIQVLKFGGTSVGSAENIRRVAGIIRGRTDKGHRPVVVVSAFSGVTNLLLRLTEQAPAGNDRYRETLRDIEQRHREIIAALFSGHKGNTPDPVDPMLARLREIVHGIHLLHECSPRTRDLVLSFGERLSATIIAAFLRHRDLDAAYADAAGILVSDDRFGAARLNREESARNICDTLPGDHAVNVVTGFIAATPEGVVTTLGRGGSDYTAAILAAALRAPEVEIWSDVNGVMSANPSVVPAARSLTAITYREAMELSHFGAGVLYPPTIQPAMERNIPIRILNTFDPAFPGTRIDGEGAREKRPVTGITAINDIALLTIEGSGMVGVPGVAARLFHFLAAADINVILITQASSEHSICVAVAPGDVRRARVEIEKGFRHEITAREMERVRVQKGLSVLAVVGQNMRHAPGIAARLFSALGGAGINVLAIAQGSSELNVSVVVRRDDLDRALNRVHGAFMENETAGAVFLMGCGGVGGALLGQLAALGTAAPRVCGIANSRRMVLNPAGIDPRHWRQTLENDGQPLNGEVMLDALSPGAVLVDCTASEEATALYEAALKKGVHVVTANKIALAASRERYVRLRRLAEEAGVTLGYEATVGAGLPVMATLKMLRRCGDDITRVEGVLSGSLSYIFSNFDPDTAFDAIVRRAGDEGYTEPDPRLDLSGADVARKILIIARECGSPAEPEEVRLENFLPRSCIEAADVPAFFRELEHQRDYFESLADRARRAGKKLCHSARYEKNLLTAGLIEIDARHPFYDLRDGENMLIIHSRLYAGKPLIIRGMGAGTGVTASAVLNDILLATGRERGAVTHARGLTKGVQ